MVYRRSNEKKSTCASKVISCLFVFVFEISSDELRVIHSVTRLCEPQQFRRLENDALLALYTVFFLSWIFNQLTLIPLSYFIQLLSFCRRVIQTSFEDFPPLFKISVILFGVCLRLSGVAFFLVPFLLRRLDLSHKVNSRMKLLSSGVYCYDIEKNPVKLNWSENV